MSEYDDVYDQLDPEDAAFLRGLEEAQEQLRLNRLNRFHKQSPRFVLEEHGSCEVPAGCGGVVLRWRDPHAGLLLRLRLVTRASEANLRLDGVEPLSLTPVPFGRHVLTCELSALEAGGVLLFMATPREGERARREAPVVLTRDDGTWRYTTEEPPAGWEALDFDDSAWPALVEGDFPEPTGVNDVEWVRITREGGVGLGPQAPAARLWVRKAFEVTP